jgi:thioredoxin-like negative regulator of GroEL
MSTLNSKAVFLSYASQDADAARRICEALRAAGVEVWFDQSELRGGDSWDAKIRKQIKECALFVAVISANTNSRPEGYFRLEWKLAVDRSHLMAHDQAFIVPVVIDDSSQAAARVPEKFQEVQWTRLQLDETPTEFSARVRALLSGEDMAASSWARGTSPPPRKPSIWWTRVVPLAGVLVGILYGLGPFWTGPHEVRDEARTMKQVSTQRDTEARQLAMRVRGMTIDKYNSGQDDYAAAEPLLKRALELDPADAEILAISSLFNTAIGTRGFDHAPARRETARSHAERALALAPDSVEGLYALGRWQRDNEPDAALAEASFKQVLQRSPKHLGATLTLAIHYMRRDRFEEALPLFQEAATRPETKALALYNMFLGYFTLSRFEEAERCVRESIATEPAPNSQAGLAFVLMTAKGDPDAAAQILATGPAAVRAEHRTIWITAYAHYLRRAPDEMLRTVGRLSDDFIQDNWFVGPKSYWAGRAHALAGRPAAARVAWEAGLALMRTKLAQDPQNASLRIMQAELLALLGREEEALREAKAVEEMEGRGFWLWSMSPARVYAVLGRAEEALAFLHTAEQLRPEQATGWPLTAALLRLDPSWDPIRNHPKFVERVAMAAAAEKAAAPTRNLPAAASTADKPDPKK